MILFPAIDLKDGRCVRLVRGEMAQATVFNDDPAAQARTFAGQGFPWLHIVDLNGAFAGRPVNAAAVDAILAAVTIPVQPGRSDDSSRNSSSPGVNSSSSGMRLTVNLPPMSRSHSAIASGAS